MKKMYGVVTPVVTPFTAEGKVDRGSLELLADFLIDKGVHGLYPNGSTGEMSRMTLEERRLVAETVVRRTAGRVGVYIQVGARTTAETISLAQHAAEIGADGIGVLTPQYMGVTEEEMEDYYVSVSESVPEDFPVYLYNIPQCSGNDLLPATVDQILKRTKNVVGIKYSFADIERFRQYLLCGDDFDVIVGPDRLLLPGLSMGCKGTVAGCSQCDPTPFVQCYEAFRAGDIAGAKAANARINALCDIVRAGSNIAYTKAALESMGLPRMYVRQPSKELDEPERQRLAEALRAYHAQYPD